MPVTQTKGGHLGSLRSPAFGFVLQAKALHGNPYDGHTLGPVITEMEKLTGAQVRRTHIDKGCVAGAEGRMATAPPSPQPATTSAFSSDGSKLFCGP